MKMTQIFLKQKKSDRVTPIFFCAYITLFKYKIGYIHVRIITLLYINIRIYARVITLFNYIIRIITEKHIQQ